MPLLDHFRGPVAYRSWSSFYLMWSASLGDALNRALPHSHTAEIWADPCGRTEYAVTEFDGPTAVVDASGHGAVTVPFQFADSFSVRVYDINRARRLLAVVELVCPLNKEHPEGRETLAMRSLGYLKDGVGLVLVDIVTGCDANLHDEVVRLGRLGDRLRMAGAPATYAVAYRPVRRGEQNLLDVWPHELSLGAELPTVPLALLGEACVPLDLEATYTDACRRSRTP